MKIYAASVSAFNQLHVNAPAGGSYIEHIPALISAENINDAADRLKEFAFRCWPVSEHWYAHIANVHPVADQFTELALRAHASGAIDIETAEDPQTFHFNT